MKPLTPAMQDLLDAMRRGARVHYIGGVNAYYFRSDTRKLCTKQVDALQSRGLVREVTRDWKTYVELS